MMEVLVRIHNSSARDQRYDFTGGLLIAFPHVGGFRVSPACSVIVPANAQLEVLLCGEWCATSDTPRSWWPIPDIDIVRMLNVSVDPWLRHQVANFCALSRQRFDRNFQSTDGEVLVLKYIPAIRLESVLRTGQLFAANGAGYTWGDAVYVSPIDTPFSTMMYGDVGVVGRYRPTTVFDGTDPYGVHLYQTWIQTQFRWYDLLTTTIHSEVANRFLRNRFRSTFGIDCVFFRPDQFAPHYVNRTDYWFAVSHWVPSASGRRVAGGPTSVIQDLEFCVVVSERFHGTQSKFLYKPMLGDVLRLRNTDPFPLQLSSPNYANALRTAYANRHNNPKPPVLVTHEQP